MLHYLHELLKNGILHFSVFQLIILTLVLTHITIAGVTIYLHRHQAHRALELHPVMSHFFRFWLWLTTGMTTKGWVSVHRKHHTFSDHEGDPHSPQVFGIKEVLFRGVELYQAEAKKQETLDKYGYGTPNDWLEQHIYQAHERIGIMLMLVLDFFLMGVPGVIVWAIQMLWIPIMAAGIINGAGHFWGYRNFEIRDTSTNIFPWGILIGGEELHNNHHTYASSAKLSVRWWEFDIGWFYIKVMSYLGLATIKKRAPKSKSLKNVSDVTFDTFKAIVSNRFEILRTYYKKVTLPILKNTSVNINKEYFKLLLRDQTFFTKKEQRCLQGLCKQNKQIEIVYTFLQKLQAVWKSSTKSKEEVVKALESWCKNAEQSGVESLKQFSFYIKGYRTVN